MTSVVSTNQPVNEWEELRKKARRLQNELDMKLLSFNKLGSNQLADYKTLRDSEKAALLPLSTSDRMFETMSVEIEKLLADLTQINDKMAEYTQDLSTNGSHGSSSLIHTLQRHRDILTDYSHEYQKTRLNIIKHREREDLLGSVQRDIDSFKSGVNRRSDLLLKENEHIRASDRLVDEHINIAISTKEHLVSQRSMFGTISQRINTLSHRFPVLNSLIQRINIRKRRDTIIIGIVIALCTIFLIFYAFH